MRPADNIEQYIKQQKIKTNPEVNKAVLNDLLDQLDTAERTEKIPPQPNRWRIIMHSRMTKFSAAAVLVFALLLFYNTQTSTLYAQVIKAMERAKTVHATGYRLQEGQMVKANEIWYKRDVGYKMAWQHKGSEQLMIDDGQSVWKYKQGHDFAVKSKSVSTERLPKEITETSRYIEKCTKDENRVDMINGTPCQVYIGSYPDKPDSTRLMFWVDENLRPRHFEEKVLEDDTWKTIELVDIEYDIDIDASVFKPDFGPQVEIIDGGKGGKILDDHFSLENAIFTKEEMSLIFAVHEVRKCENDLIFTVTSLRPNQELKGKYASKGITAWNYGDYQLGSSYERLGPNKHRSYGPIQLAWFYRDGLVIRWTVFIPHGFEPGQLDKIKLELYYLYARGSWGAKRKADGLEDRIRIKPIAVLPLPDDTLTLESQLNKTYNLIKLLEPMVAEKHLQLKSIPFTDEEMEERIKVIPNDGIAKMWKEGKKSSRLGHGQSKRPSQINFEDWFEDRLEEIEKCQNQ
ncbi:MAG: LolA family protein [Planctomycetota bacterium]|jgi:outer membrane lipoprotein-sorting protein